MCIIIIISSQNHFQLIPVHPNKSLLVVSVLCHTYVPPQNLIHYYILLPGLYNFILLLLLLMLFSPILFCPMWVFFTIPCKTCEKKSRSKEHCQRILIRTCEWHCLSVQVHFLFLYNFYSFHIITIK